MLLAADPLLAAVVATPAPQQAAPGSVTSDFSPDIFAVGAAADSGCAGGSGNEIYQVEGGEPLSSDSTPAAASEVAVAPETREDSSQDSAAVSTTISAPNEPTVDTNLPAAGASQTDVTNPVTQQLTDTLNAANGPPAGGGNSVHLTPDTQLNLGSTLSLGSGDVLSGTGTLLGDVVNNGLVSPGNSPGITNVVNFTQGPNGTTLIEIGGTAGAGVNPNGWDQINASGTATLDGTIQLAFYNGFVPNLGDSFQIFTWGSVTGEFANWLGTANIPGHSSWAFKPTYGASGLTLTVVQTPVIAGPAGSAITTGLGTLSNVANFLEDAGEFAESIPFIGSNLGALSGLGTAIQNAINARLASLPNPAQVTSTIESWNSTSFGGFTFAVKGVLAHYGATSADPMWWDVTIELSPSAVNRALQNVLGGIFGAIFTGSPTVNVSSKVVLDFAFGYDGGAGGFFVEMDSLSAQASVTASGLGGFGFSFNTPAGTQGLTVSGGTVNLTASVTATPNGSILTGGRITQTTLATLNATNIGSAFDLTNAGTLNAAFPLTGTLSFLGFSLTGAYTLRIQSNDLMNSTPDVTLDVNSDLTIMQQTLHGAFTLKNTGTETIIEASNIDFQLNTGATRILSVQNGSGTFVLLGSDLAGTMTMDLNLGPAIPNVVISATTLSLAFNTSTSPVPTIDGLNVNLPAGPYYRVSGHATIALTNPAASLTGDFVFEPRDTDSNTGNGYEETAVGVANLSFTFTDGANPLVNVTNGTGAFVFRSGGTGLVGSLSASASLAVSGLSVTGVFGVLLNDTNAAYNQTINVNGTSVLVNVPVGPYLRVTAKGNTSDADTSNDHAVMTVLGLTLTGDFTYERRRTTTGGEQVVTVAGSSLSLDLGSVANDLISVTNGSAAFIITNAGVAGTSTATITTNIPGVTLGGTFTVRVNNTNALVNETVSISGGPIQTINLPTGPYLQLSGTGATIGFLGVTLTGDFTLKQDTAVSGRQLIAVTASGVHFDFGTSLINLTNGSGDFLITDDGIAGHGQITAAVSAFGGGFSHTFDWSFNTTGGPVDEVVIDPIDLDVPSGPFNQIDTGSVVGISVPIGSYTQTINGRFILTMVTGSPNYVTVAASSVSATVGSGALGISVSNGSGAFVIYTTGIAGEVNVGTASLSGAGLLTLTAENLKLRFNNTNADVGNPTPIVIAINDTPADNISLQFIGAYYRNYLSVAGTAEIGGLTGAITLGGSFVFERGRLDTNNDTVLEDVFTIAATSLHFDLKAGSYTVVSFNNGTGTFLIKPDGIAGTATLQFQSGMVGISGSISLQLNTSPTAISNAFVPTPTGPVVLNIAGTSFVRVNVNGFLHLGSIALPFNFYVLIGGAGVEFHRTSDNFLLVSVSNAGVINVDPSLSFSDFAAPGPFEFVSMLRQALIWLDSFRGANIFDVGIPFTDKTLGDAFDWTQVFVDSIYSKMVSIELQSRTLALQTDTVAAGNLVNAKVKIQLGTETPQEVVFSVNYSNADNNLDELVNAFNAAILPANPLYGRVAARIHKFKDQAPTDPDYVDRFKDDVFVIALTETEAAKGTELKLVDLDSQFGSLGFGPPDSTYGDANDTTPEQIGVLVDRYDTKHFVEILADLLNDGVINGNGGVAYNAAQQVYTYAVNQSLSYNTQQLFGVSEIPFNWNLDLGPIASASLSGSLLFNANMGFHFLLGFDLGAREVPRLLTQTTVPVPANGRLTDDAHFTLTLNNEAPISLTLPKTDGVTPLNNSVDELAADLNRVFHNTFYSGPLTAGVSTRLDQLIVAQKAGSGLAISALQEPDADNNGVPDTGKDYNGDGNTDSWLGLINRLVAVSLKNDTFATEMGFGIQVVDLDGSAATTNDQLFISSSSSTIKGLFIDKAPGYDRIEMNAAVAITTKFNTPGNPNDPDGIQGTLRFGFVEISTNNGSFGTVAYDGTTPNPLSVALGIQNQTTGATRFYLSELFNGTSSNNIGNMLVGPTFSGSLLARLDQITVGGLGFNFPLGANPRISAWIPDINHLSYNASPYDPSTNNQGIFLTYPSLDALQNFTSFGFTQIIQALNIIADNLSQLSAFSFLDEPLPFVNLSVNDMIDYAQKFADLIDGAQNAGSQTSLQATIAELQHQIEVLFNLSPNILSISLDDGGLSGLTGVTSGGSPATQSSVIINPTGANNAIQIRTTILGTAASFNGSLIRFIADSGIVGAGAAAQWNAATRVLTVRINSARTTANAIITAINGAGSPFLALLNAADPGNTGAGTVVTSSFTTTGGINGSFQSAATLMPGGENNNFTITSTGSLATAATMNGTSIRMLGDSAVSGNTAQVSWDTNTKTLTLKINPGVTTANTIINAINLAGIPWNAALAPPDNSVSGNTGANPITTSALKFSFNFQTAYANSLPFQLDLADLVSNLAGDNSAIRAFLEAATTLVQIRGSGELTVSAGAKLTLDFGLDLSNPATVKPFFYDTTGVELTAKVLGTNLEVEASLGAVFGIFIKNGKVTLDADGDPTTTAAQGDQGAIFRLGLKDSNGDGRHYFNETWFDSNNIDLTLQGGVSAQLPIFAPTESTPLSGDADANGDGYPDNVLAIEIPDLLRLFISEAVSTSATGAVKVVKFAGLNNDLNISSDLYTNYKIIFLDTLSGNAANASFNVGTNTLTVNIDAGTTTAVVARNAIQAATGGGGHFAVTALTSDDDGNAAAPHANSGDGKLEKISIITPDFSQLFGNLDFCSIITEHLGDILNGLDALLGQIQDGLNEIVYNTDLPLIGNGLQGAANFIGDFRAGLLQNLRDEVNTAGGNGATAVENAIKKALWNTLGPGGLDLLVNYDTGEALDSGAGFSQLAVTLDCDTGLIVNIRLKKDVALLDTSQNPIDFQIGVPGFGLEVDGNVKVSIGFDLKFGFGFNTADGFYFNSSAPADDPELVIEFKAEIPGLHAAGQLLFLQLDVTDNADSPSMFRGFFEVDLMDPNHDGKLTFAEITSSGTQLSDIVHANLGAEAHINLKLAASFGGNTAFPRVLAQFHLDWVFDLDHGAGTPQISVTDIYLDLGSFISDFLGPILEKIQDVTEPLQPILDLVTARIPILSDLAGEDITLLTLAEVFGLLEPSTVEFINDVIQVITLINSLEGLGEGEILIPFGAFSLTADNNGEMKNIAALQQMGERTLDEIANAAANATGPGTSSSFSSASAGFVSDAGSLHNFSIPIFDHPTELFNLFIGEPVRLVEWRMPAFKFQFTYTQKIPIYPPLYAQFGGSIGATINIGFGYDTYGIQKFIASEDKNFLDILDGFYVLDFDANGHEQPELQLTGEIFAGASISLLIVEVGVQGGVQVTFNFDLNDVNDDGKVRVSEIIANAQQDPRCIFDIDGEITLFLEAYLKVDLFFFSIEKTWRFAEITLLEFHITCPEPILASGLGGNPYTSGDLYLNIGSRAHYREQIDTADNSERFIVKHISGSAGNEVIEIQWGNFKQQFTMTGNLMVEDAGQGDDYIDLRGVLSTVAVHLGTGNDTLYLGDGTAAEAWGDGGNDTITASTQSSASSVILHGGDGNDTLLGGSVTIEIHGGEGRDTITGSPQYDLLYGDGGDDNIDALDGDDYVDAGAGNDTVEGGAGNDFLLGGAGTDTLRGSRGDDVIDGGDGDDQLYGSDGNDLLIGGNGGDKAFGHGGVDLLIGDKVGTINTLAVTYANLSGLLAAVAAIPNTGITVKGLTGTGNDFLVGGGNVDVLFGGDGDDYLYGGNFLSTGDTEVIEEDGNDFFDGGRGNDTIFGDDSMGREGIRNTGISIQSSIWFDANLNGLRDAGETGFGGVTVKLYRQSDSHLIATEESEVDGSFAFNGLDPNDYYLTFSIPTGMSLVTQYVGGATHADDSATDNDAVLVGLVGKTDQFNVDFGETESAVAAGFTGPAQVSVSDISVTEGSNGQTAVNLVVTLSHLQGFAVEIDYKTADGTATVASGDYQAVTTTTLTFAPGETSKTITIWVNGDTMYELLEQFQLLVVRAQLMVTSAPVNLSVNHTPVLITIVNDDQIPTLSISDFRQVGVDDDNDPLTPPVFNEGMKAHFVVSLSNPSQFAITVQWRTDAPTDFQGENPENSATPSGFPGADFILATGTLTFQPGETSKAFDVTIINDTLDENEEHFYVDLFNPAYADISDGRAYGIIEDDDAMVSAYIVPVTPIGGAFTTEVTEGNGGTTPVGFWVKLDAASGKTVTVTWATTPGTAVEAVYSGANPLTDPLDYVSTPNQNSPDSVINITFLPGETQKFITVLVNGDTVAEGVVDPGNPAHKIETFFVNILSANNAEVAAQPLLVQSNHVTVKIVDDDTITTDAGPWSIYFDSLVYTVQEPTSGDAYAYVTIRRTPGSSDPVAVFYTTNGTATAGSDYDAVFRQVIYFNGNETAKTVTIKIHSDSFVEGSESVNLFLKNPTGGPVRAFPDRAVLRITDGNTPTLAFQTTSLTFTEGTAGTPITRNISVELRDPLTNSILVAANQQSTVTVTYKIVDLTARLGSDYQYALGFPVTGTITFSPGQVSKTISVDIIRDSIPELTENFAIQLSNPSGAALVENETAAFVTINDDDLTPILIRVFYDNNGNGFKDLSEKAIKDVGVKFTYDNAGVATTVAGVYTFIPALNDYYYQANVLLGQITVALDGTTVTSPYKDTIFLFFGSGDYETTTDNETQSVSFKGIVGLSPFADVGYKNTTTFSQPSKPNDSGRGGTDDTIFGGPGNDIIDGGAGDDHIVGGHWMTATDEHAPINDGDDGLASYNAVITVTKTGLHPVYDNGPIFDVNTTSPDAGINANGAISGQIWQDNNNNGRQDAGEPLFTQLVFVNLYDCDGNPINTVVTTTGSYTFTGLYLKGDGSDSEYVVEFVLPHDYAFSAVGGAVPANVNQDVIIGGRTSKVVINNGTPAATDIDAGVKGSGLTRLQVTGGFQFSEASYSVSETVKNGVITIAIERTTSYDQRAVVVKTFNGTAVAGVNFIAVTTVLFFDVGETIKTLDIQIINTGLLGICVDPLTINLELRDATGRPYDRAVVYVGGPTFGNNPDDDLIYGGGDWDIILGDSGHIPAVTVIDPNPPYNNLSGIVYSAGPGKDTIFAGDGTDFVNGQLGNDIISGDEGRDQIEAGLGDDIIYVTLDDDTINGDYGRDTVISSRDVSRVELIGTTVAATLEHKNSAGDSLSTFTLSSVEVVRITTGGMKNSFFIKNWDGALYLYGAGNTDSLEIENATDMIVKDASFLEGLLFELLYGFFKDASISLANGATYHLGSLESVKITLTGVASNTINGAGYTRPLTLATLGGNDTLIGGSADDKFLFLADAALGTNTVTGNGGRDTLDFSGTTLGVAVDLAVHASQFVNANLNLILTDDLENVTGGSGNDFLYGNALNNVLIGGRGNDWLQGRGGNETYAYDGDAILAEHDTIVEDAGGGNDTLDFSATLNTSINVNIAIVGAQNVTTFLTLTIQDSGGGEAEIENIVGGAKADTIRGNAYNNTLRGGAGNDLLDGKGGNDILDGGAGNDDLNGGDGLLDTINETANTNFILTNSSLTRGTGEIDTLNNIEVANLTGGAGNNTFTLTGWTGSGSLNGGGGDDTVVWAADANFLLSDLALTVTPVSGPVSNFTLSSIEAATLTGGPGDNSLNAAAFTGDTILSGGEGKDVLVGGAGIDILRGGLGNDTLTGNRSNDIIDGGAGSDTLIEDLSAFAGSVDFVIQNNLLVMVLNDPNPAPPDETVTEGDVLTSIEIAILKGSPQDDTIDVSGWSAGALTVDGQGGSDTVKSTAPNAGTLKLTNTGITFTDGSGTSAASLTFSSIELVYLYGSSGDDVLDATSYTGTAALIGGDGNDILMGGPGLNLLQGDAGDDRFIFRPDGSLDLDVVAAGSGTDTLDFSAFGTAVTINLSTLGAVQNVVAGELQIFISSIPGPAVEEIENLIGGSAADTLTGNALNNRITGGAGADVINGLGGTNTMVEQADADMFLTNGSLTIGGVAKTLSNFQEAELTGGTSGNTIDASAFTLGPVTLDGGAGNDRLIGGTQGDILIGGGGNDLLRGGAGNDTYRFDVDQVLGADTIDELPGAANGLDLLDFAQTTTVGVSVDLSVTTPQTVHATNLKLTLTSGASLEYIIGGDGNDTLVGNALDNGFIGGKGSDVIRGGAGNNFIFETRDADFVLASSAPTTATLTITDATGSELDALTDIQLVELIGGASNNLLDATGFTGQVYLFGMGGNDSLYGGSGADYLSGGDGEDTLRGNGGDDSLTGGNDSDTYVFDQSFQQGSDTITEAVGEGAHDKLLGVGIAGIDIDLFSSAVQIIGVNLTLTLTYPSAADAGQIEHSF